MSYAWSIALIVFAVVGLVLVYRVVRGQRIEIYAPADLERHAQPVDLAAFQALVDPANDRFATECLTAADARAFRRGRLRVAAAYVRRVAHNAAVLTQLAELARTSPDTETARAGAELANAATQLRLLALLALARLHVELLYPAAPSHVRHIAGLYESLADQAAALSRRLDPAMGVRSARSLYAR